MNKGEQVILVFSCSFGWAYQGDPEWLELKIENRIPVACCGKVEAEQILHAVKEGADGVLLLACPRGECHFQDGENQLEKRVELLKALLKAHRMGPERLALHFGNDPSGESIPSIIARFAELLATLNEEERRPDGR